MPGPRCDRGPSLQSTPQKGRHQPELHRPHLVPAGHTVPARDTPRDRAVSHKLGSAGIEIWRPFSTNRKPTANLPALSREPTASRVRLGLYCRKLDSAGIGNLEAILVSL